MDYSASPHLICWHSSANAPCTWNIPHHSGLLPPTGNQCKATMRANLIPIYVLVAPKLSTLGHEALGGNSVMLGNVRAANILVYNSRLILGRVVRLYMG